MDIEFTLPVQQVSTGKYSILVNVEGVNSEKILSNAIFYFLPSNIVNIDCPRETFPLPHGFFHFAPLSSLLIAFKSPQSHSNSLQNIT